MGRPNIIKVILPKFLCKVTIISIEILTKFLRSKIR